MRKLFALACASALAAPASADPYTSARQRARDVVKQSNERQEQIARAVSPPPANAPQTNTPPRTAQRDPVLAATLQNIANLQADLAGLETNAAGKQLLIDHLNAAAKDAKPSKNSVSKLADDLAAALAGKHLSQEQRMKLAHYTHAIFNSSHVSPAQQRAVLTDTQKILQGAGVSSDDATKIVNDIKTIASETK